MLKESIFRTRPDAMSLKGVTATSSLQASLIGSKIMERGGNVVDAAIAASAALCVTQNNLCGLGGDMFALVRMEGKDIVDYNGSGRSFFRTSIEHFQRLGIKNLPSRGPNSALTVPGIVSMWKTLNRDFGTMEISELLHPAISLASNGFPISHNYSSSIETTSRIYGEPKEFQEWNRIFRPGGRTPLPGEIFRQKDLAATLSDISRDGPDSFYNGNLADRIIKGLEGTGVVMDHEDLEKHRVTKEKPLHTDYHGHRIYETNPNTQGATVLLWLNIIKEMEEENPASGEIDLEDVINAGIISYQWRNRHITDPDHLSLPADFLTKRYAGDLLHSQEKLKNNNGENRDSGDTTYFSICDYQGNSVSIIQSNYMGFGSGVMPKSLGFVLQNRGSYFSLDNSHHNSLKPGKRTFHTLCAAMVEKDGDFRYSLGTMGGDIQPQIHVQMIMNLIDSGLDPQLSLDMPRWAFPGSIYEKPNTLIFENDLTSMIPGKRFAGLNTKNIGRYSSQAGHAQITALTDSGSTMGGSDPRGDGVAIPVL
ncbi:gamma-glutamyltransferase family protein [Oxyplasma meridianum]|uniref:Gamma-glutamyltransferase family protein n=1 Tax=Oxyplasma meridianum TaxID=3073602 RepID=A0AAX4NH09_9ARCH